MKKKIIFIIEALWMGGLEISLMNILDNLDYERYDVTVLAMRNYTELLSRVSPRCRVLIADRQNAVSFSKPYPYKRLYNLMEEPQNATKLRRHIWKILCAVLKAPEEILWSAYVRNCLEKEHYDTAVIYDNRTAETAVRAVHASKFLMFYHQGVMSHAYHDTIGWKKAEKIIAVSEPIAQRLKGFMPKYAAKVIAINNLVDVHTIREKSEEKPDVQFDNTKIRIVSCGRFSKEKGMHIALDACSRLKESGFSNFSWYFIGGGEKTENFLPKLGNCKFRTVPFCWGKKKTLSLI